MRKMVITKMQSAVALVGVLATLSGCAEMVVGGAVMSAGVMADRRTVGAQADDKAIVIKGEAAFADQADSHVNVASYDGRVLLTGEVPSAVRKMESERTVLGFGGVREVFNELEVAPVSGLRDRSLDTLITAKVRAAFMQNHGTTLSAVKVVTERGVVYLMGQVNAAEAEIATQAASGVGGVKKVVKLFKI